MNSSYAPIVPDTPIRGSLPKNNNDDVIIKEVLLGLFLTLSLVIIILTQRCVLQKRFNNRK